MFSPKRWVDAARSLRRSGKIKRADWLLIGFWTLLSSVSEGLGLGMVLPLLVFLERGGDIAVLTTEHRFWRVMADIHAAVGLPVSMMSLSSLILLAIIFQQVTQYAAAVTVSKLIAKTEKGFRDYLFRNLLHGSLLDSGKIGAGGFVEALLAQCHSASQYFQQLLSIFTIILTFVAYAIMLGIIAPVPTTLALLMVLGFGVIVGRFTQVTKRLSERQVYEQKHFMGWIAERYAGRALIKSAAAEDRECVTCQAGTEKLARLQYRVIQTSALLQLVLVSLGTTFVLIALTVATETMNISVPLITLFAVASLRLLPLGFNFASLVQRAENRIASIHRVIDVANRLSPHIEQDRGLAAFSGPRHAIRFDDVRFAYPDAGFDALQIDQATIPAGRMTAIVGPSGAGKSSLVNLLPRFIDADSGNIFIDDVPLANFSLPSLRLGVAVLHQNPILFDESIIDNVRYLKPDADELAVTEACRKAHADDFIQTTPNGYHSRLGEAGVNFSGGQRQRIALARVFLSNASVLILDEPTSALDHESEEKISDALDHLIKDRGITAIVIAHRASTIRKADHIIVMEGGRIVQSGSPQQLHLDEGWYRSMRQRAQLDGFAEGDCADVTRQ